MKLVFSILLVCWIFIHAVLLFWNIGHMPFWVDESATVLTARQVPQTGLLLHTEDMNFMPWQIQNGLWDPMTPLYRYAVSGVTWIFGFSETTTRSFSAVMALLSLGWMYSIFRKTHSSQIALMSVAIMISSPVFLGFSREARHFSMLMFLMAWTAWHLLQIERNRSSEPSIHQVGWVTALWATLLCQSMGYLWALVVGIYVLWKGPKSYFSKKWIPVYVLLGSVYGVLFFYFHSALPFFHEVDCGNRPDGCHPTPFYYLGLLYLMMGGHPFFPQPVDGLVLPYVPAIMLIGVVVFIRTAKQHRLLALWVLLPCVILSMHELKFPRYLYMYVMPFLGLWGALGIQKVVTWLKAPRAEYQQILITLVLISVLSLPQWDAEHSTHPWQSTWWRYLQERIWHPLDDNWQRVRFQTQFLQEQAAPKDVVVSTLDDSALSYYANRRIYSFLNNQHTDSFFLELLEEAQQSGSTLWLLNTLPQHNYCLTADPEPQSIDCREKFRQFYEKCHSTEQTTCRILNVHSSP